MFAVQITAKRAFPKKVVELMHARLQRSIDAEKLKAEPCFY
jgi:hypothetical protein